MAQDQSVFPKMIGPGSESPHMRFLMVLIGPISCAPEHGNDGTIIPTTNTPLVPRSKIPAGAITSTLNLFFRGVSSSDDASFNEQSAKTVGLNTLLSRKHSRILQATSIMFTVETIPKPCTSIVPIFRYTARPTIIIRGVRPRCRPVTFKLTHLHSPLAYNTVTISRSMTASVAGGNDASATVRISPAATNVRRAFRFTPFLGSPL